MKRQMTQNEIIRYVLGDICYLDWANYRMGAYCDWCLHWANERCLPLRLMILNESLFNWYCHQWNELEGAFYRDNKDYFFAGVDEFTTYSSLLRDYVKELVGHYPAAIFNMIKKEYKAKIHGTD